MDSVTPFVVELEKLMLVTKPLILTIFITAIQLYTVKKAYRFSCPQPGVWLLTNGLGTGKSLNFFYSVGLNVIKKYFVY